MKRVQCPCGKLLAVPDGRSAAKFRCPACGSVLRVREKGKQSRAAAPVSVASAAEPDDGGYEIVPEPQPPDVERKQPGPPLPAWIPSEAAMAADRRHQRTYSVPTGSAYGTASAAVPAGEFPGPFIDLSALFFPFLHPTWACWLGLSFMTALALAAVCITAFFLTIIMTLGVFASLFTFATMLIACVALVGYLMTAMEEIFEETAHGSNRMARLPGLSFADNLPPFLRGSGALLSTIAVAGEIVYLLRNHLGEWETAEWVFNPVVAAKMVLIFDVVAWALFPVFLISNSVQQSFWPIWALHTTVLRLIRCAPYFVLFLLFSAIAGFTVNLVLFVLSLIHWSVALAFVGPLWAMYLMYYAHWLGRVARQMTVLDDLEAPRWLMVTMRAAVALVVVTAIGWWCAATAAPGLVFSLSDGKYIMRLQADGVRELPKGPIEEEHELRIRADGTIEFRDEFGLAENTQVTMSRGIVELRHNFQGVPMSGKGKLTGTDRLEGSCTLKIADDRFLEPRVIERQAKWSLRKKK